MILSEKTIRKIVRKKILKEIDVDTGVAMGFKNIDANKKGNETEDNGVFGSLSKIDLEKESMAGAGKNAADLLSSLGGKGEKTEEDRIAIVTAVHLPIYDAIKGSGRFKKDNKESGGKTLFDYYKDGLGSKAWSSWFLNRCYLGTPAESFIKGHGATFGHSGCCYPYLAAMKNRKDLIENPESKKGKSIVILATKEEVEELGGFADGDASIVGQGGAAPTLEFIAGQKKLSSGKAHMNIKSGGNWIGGNLGGSKSGGGTVKTAGDDTQKANAFMIMVKVKGLKDSKPGDKKKEKK